MSPTHLNKQYLKLSPTHFISNTNQQHRVVKKNVNQAEAEIKESVDGLKATLSELPLREIKERANQLNVPMIISGNLNLNLMFQKS